MAGTPSAIVRPGPLDILVTRGVAGGVEITFPDGWDMSGVDTCVVSDGTTDIDLSGNIVVSGSGNRVVTFTWSAANATAMTSGSSWRWYLADGTAAVYLEGRVSPSDIRGSAVSGGGSGTVTLTASSGVVPVTVLALGSPGTDGTDGLGVPAGGTTGQVLAKASGADNDTEWSSAGSGDLISTNNLDDLDNAATARTNLGLGDSATRDVGTGSGDVAAGDAPASAVSTHSADTTSVHGIADTSALVTTSDLSTTTYNEVADAGATETLAWAQAPDEVVHDITMTENCTISFGSASGDNEVNSMTVIIRGAFTPTLPASVDWAGGSAPTYGAPSVYEFVTVDNGTTVLGFLAGATVS